jgi:hypothetical protein
LADRLIRCLDGVISPQQSAFILGRYIAENIMHVSIQSYCTSVFILPKKVIKNLEHKFNRFTSVKYIGEVYGRENERKRIIDYIVLSLNHIVLQETNIYREAMSSRQKILD